MGLIETSITAWMQFYIQAAVVEKGISIKNLWHSKIDDIIRCCLMSVVTLLIIICCAATIHKNGIKIKDTKDASLALKPLAGPFTSCNKLLDGVGIGSRQIF